LVIDISLCYDARSKKHQNLSLYLLKTDKTILNADVSDRLCLVIHCHYFVGLKFWRLSNVIYENV